jgi:hypothetical protein
VAVGRTAVGVNGKEVEVETGVAVVLAAMALQPWVSKTKRAKNSISLIEQGLKSNIAHFLDNLSRHGTSR